MSEYLSIQYPADKQKTLENYSSMLIRLIWITKPKDFHKRLSVELTLRLWRLNQLIDAKPDCRTEQFSRLNCTLVNSSDYFDVFKFPKDNIIS
jgi:hypothetical protein